ncbi:MAG TPA: nickel pincer cofactor biosynthesis protein LarB, partial [Candidatus Nanoarchaeia archaeon]|nr:nickel pincer cofactor biosynthesis protein LarB [Candidatus Nanoarchaeia archaeon]
MHEKEIRELMQGVSDKRIKIDEAIKKLKFLPYEDLGFAKLDYHRNLRKGFPEVIFCQSKTNEQVKLIAEKFVKNGSDVIATRASEELFKEIKKQFKDAVYNKQGRIITIIKSKKVKKGKILILSAGTSDMQVVEEARVMAESMGNNVEAVFDVGVAGLHRLLSHKEKILEANAIIVVAGMDGALPSVVSGLTDKPVIAVPTSVGYGASFNGLAALLTMLNSCSPGVVVVNIDNGFGAGY